MGCKFKLITLADEDLCVYEEEISSIYLPIFCQGMPCESQILWGYATADFWR